MSATRISSSWLRGFDDNLEDCEMEKSASEDGVVAKLTEKINLRIKSCVENHVCSDIIASKRFCVELLVISEDSDTFSSEILPFLFRAKYTEFSRSYGLKVNWPIKR